ncbi:hypothetical protein AAAX73_08820 [Collinsella sp. CLA-ER-H9]
MAGFHACYDLAYLYGWKMPLDSHLHCNSLRTQRNALR